MVGLSLPYGRLMVGKGSVQRPVKRKQQSPKRAMLKAGGDLMENSADTNQVSQPQRHENHDTENEHAACLRACRKPMKAKLEQDQTAS